MQKRYHSKLIIVIMQHDPVLCDQQRQEKRFSLQNSISIYEMDSFEFMVLEHLSFKMGNMYTVK